MRCGSGLSKGLCLICASRYGNNPNPNSLNDSPNISENVSQSPPLIDHHCCYGCGDSLDGIFCQRCTCESCGNGAHYGYNCPPKVPTISNPEPCHNQNVDEFPQTLPSFHPTCYSGDENSFTYDSNLNFVDDSPNPPPQPPTYSCEFCGNDAHYGYDCPPQVPFIYNPEPCYNQDFNFPQNLQSFQQQYICCTRCGGPHETFQCQQLIFDEPYCENCGGPHMSFQCQPMNQNYYEPNPCYDYNSFGFDQIQPPQYSIDRSLNKEIIDSLQSMFEEFRKRQPAANIDQLPSQEMSIQDMEDLKNDARYGHYCTPQVPFIYLEPCYNQDFNFPQDFHDFQQQYLCCENCGGPHETFQCQPMNEDYYHEQNSCYDSNSFGFDQFQPPQYTVNHPIFNAQNELLNSQNKIMEQMTSICDMVGQYMQKKEEDRRIAEDQAAKDRYWKIPICYDDDEDYTIAITPVLSTEEPVDSLIMEDEHLDTIPATESDEVIKSSVENLVPIPSESEGIPDSVCDVPLCNNPTPLEAFKEHSETVIDFNDDSTSSDDDSPYGEDIDYVDASPPDAEIVSLEVVEIVIPEVGGIDTDILLTIKDDILREKLLNVNLLIANIEALKDNPTPSSDFMTKISSGSPTSYLDLSLPDYEALFCDSESDSGNFTMDVVEDIFDNPTREPIVHVPIVLPTHPTLHLDSDFTLSSDSLRSNLVVSFPSGTRNKIFDPGIFIEIQSEKFLSRDEFSISFIRDSFSLVIDTLLLFLSKNKDKVVNSGILALNEEKSSHLLSYRGFKPLKIISNFSKSSMMFYG
ncbi:hypothetical protein Tco_0261213 [Tanacetum coccineum]